MGDAVLKDPTGAKYPWVPPTKEEKAKLLLDSLGADLVAKAQGKPIGLYFSAHWCPPCRGFTPKLAEWYNAGLKDKMEIIFVSSDKDQASFDSYFNEMPWLALPFAKRAEKEAISDAMGVAGIPSFAVINPDGTVITTDGRSQVSKDTKGEHFPAGWLPKPLNDVNDDPSPLNEEQCAIMFGTSLGAMQVVKAVAQEFYDAAGKDVDEMPVKFFNAPPGSVAEQLRKLTGIADDQLIFLDIPSDGAFFVCDAEASKLTEAGVKEFIENAKSGKIGRKQLQK